MARVGDTPCRFIVGTKRFPVTGRGLLEARVYAKRHARADGAPRMTFGIRLSCGGKRPVQHVIETCSSVACARGTQTPRFFWEDSE